MGPLVGKIAPQKLRGRGGLKLLFLFLFLWNKHGESNTKRHWFAIST